jgi:hypothetical protein
VDLESLKVNLEGLSEEEIAEEGVRLFRQELFPDGSFRSTLKLHDGQSVVFFQDRYEHAFQTSPDRIRHPYSKSKVAVERVERVKWIKPVLQGEITGTQCWLVPDPARRQRKRLYVVVNEQYIIWLEERRDGGWKFSSAYCAGKQDIQRYTQGGIKVWER